MSAGELSEKLKLLMAEFGRSSLRQVHIREGEFEVYLSNQPGDRLLQTASSRHSPLAPPPAASPRRAPDTPAAQTKAAGQQSDIPANARIVAAPNLGTFYRAPKPGAAPYIEVGQTIVEGEELCLLEVMKLFTSVRAEAPGRLHAVLAEDGSMVEAGQPLFAVVDA